MAAGTAAPLRAHTPVHWYAVYTRARHEKQVERLLAERVADTYLPLMPRVSRWSDRSRMVAWPLFPGYVFARFAAAEHARIVEVPGVVCVVRHNGMITPIPVHELENVRRFVAALTGSPHPPEPTTLLGPGTLVEILTGPFAGVCGQVIAHPTARRVVVGLAALGQGFAINVEQAAVRTLPDERP